MVLISIHLAVAFFIVSFAGSDLVGLIVLGLKQDELLPEKRFLITIPLLFITTPFWWGYMLLRIQRRLSNRSWLPS